MTRKIHLDKSLTVSKLLELYPQVIPVFIKNRLSCVGCPMCSFDSLKDVIRIYSLNSRKFMSELRGAILEAVE